MNEDKQPLLDWIQRHQLSAERLMPHSLPEECLTILSDEAEAIKERPDTEDVARGFVSLIMALTALEGKTQITHEEMVPKLQCYLRIFSLEKLKRSGLIKAYEAPTLETVFDDNWQLDVTLT